MRYILMNSSGQNSRKNNALRIEFHKQNHHKIRLNLCTAGYLFYQILHDRKGDLLNVKHYFCTTHVQSYQEITVSLSSGKYSLWRNARPEAAPWPAPGQK